MGTIFTSTTGKAKYDIDIYRSSENGGLQLEIDDLNKRVDALPKFYDTTGMSGISVKSLPRNSYTYAVASKFTDLPSDLTGSTSVYVERATRNKAGNVSQWTVRKAWDVSFYYTAWGAEDADPENPDPLVWQRWENVPIDDTLTQSGQAADAAAVGTQFDAVDAQFDKLESYYDMSSVSSDNPLSIRSLPRNCYTYANANKFSEIPEGITGNIFVIRKPRNTAGNMSQWTITRPDDASYYYMAVGFDTQDPPIAWSLYKRWEDQTSGLIIPTYNLVGATGSVKTNLYISQAGAVSSATQTRSVVIPCKPNTCYAIMSLIRDERFLAGYSSAYPADGGTATPTLYRTEANGHYYIPIFRTDSTANYLIVYYYHSGYTSHSETDLYNALMVSEGADYRVFKPSEEIKQDIYPHSNGVFGIKFLRNSVNPVVERTHDAKGLLYRQQTGTAVEKSDFDECFPWCAMSECNVSVDNGVKTITYKGATGFSRSNDTYIEVPAFYFARSVADGVEHWDISGSPFPGGEIEPWFLEDDGSIAPYRYIAKYEGTIANDKLSVTGVAPACGKTDFGNKSMYQYYSDYCEDHGARLESIQAHLAISHLAAIEMGVLDAQYINEGVSHVPFSVTNAVGSWNVALNTNTGNAVQLPYITSSASSGRLMRNVREGDTVYLSDTSGQDNSDPRTVENIGIVATGGSDVWEIQFDGEAYPVISGTTYCFPAMMLTGRTDGMSYVNGRTGSDVFCRPFLYRGIENIYGNMWEVVSGLIWKPSSASGGAPFTIGENVTSFSAPRQPASGNDGNCKGFIKTFGYDRSMPWATLPETVFPTQDADLSPANAHKYIGDEWTTTESSTAEQYIAVGGGWDHQGENGLFNARTLPMSYQGNWLYGFRAMID